MAGFIFTFDTKAQDLAAIGKDKNPVKVTGGFSATNTFYAANGIADRRSPYYWMLSGNVNVSLYGWSIPISATITQQNKSYTQPFNQYGLSPHYKSVTLHLGYRSMQFSNFTLGGNIFLGGGIEFSPKKSFIRYSAMGGRFTKAVSESVTSGVISGTPAFERWGCGQKISLGSYAHGVDLIMFYAKDNANSISQKIADTFKLKPAENLVLAIATKQALTKKLGIDLEYSYSIYTTDITIDRTQLTDNNYSNYLGALMKRNISTQYNSAVLGGLTYNTGKFQIKLAFRRIGPEYKSMGSIYLNNDLEDVQTGLGWKMFKNKLSVNTSGGVQWNNLNQQLSSRMTRIIGSLNLVYTHNEKLNFNANVSNTMSNTSVNNSRVTANQLGLTQNVDSLKYTQVTQSASLGVNYNTGGEQIRHVLFSNLAYQKANDSQENNSSFYNVNAGYQTTYKPWGLSGTLGAVASNSYASSINSVSIGPSANISWMFRKKIRTAFAVTGLETYSAGQYTGTNLTYRISGGYKQGKHHSFTADISLLTRKVVNQPSAGTTTMPSFQEFRGSIIYAYSF